MVCTMEIMHNMSSEASAPNPKRRFYSPELKAQVVMQCRANGASIAALALAHGINAIIVHCWLREHAAATAPKPINPFIPLNLSTTEVEEAAPLHAAGSPTSGIRVEIRRGTGLITVSWSIESSSSCVEWLRDCLR